MNDGANVLVLGLGNTLLRDDAAGPVVVARLAGGQALWPGVAFRDGGTIGLGLLPEIEDARAFIAVDAARFGATPGTVRVFVGAEMDAVLCGCKRSAHEVALADLMGAAALQQRLPAQRALVAVEPDDTSLGMNPTPAVAAALDRMCIEVTELLARWRAKETP